MLLLFYPLSIVFGWAQTSQAEESRMRIERIRALMEQYNVEYPLSISEGVITCKDNKGEVVYIKADGSKAFATHTPFAYDFSDGLAVVLKDIDTASFWDKDGNVVVSQIDLGDGTLSRNGFHEGLISITNVNEKMGFLDKTGKMVIPYSYECPPEDSWFCEGLARVERMGRFGFIDRSGKEVIPLIYNHVHNFSDGRCLVKKAGEEYWINRSGQKIEDYESRFSEGVYFPYVRGKDYCIAADRNNRQVFPGHFSKARHFSEGLAWVCSLDTQLWGVVDHSGNMVVPFQYANSGGEFEDGYSVISAANRAMGLMDRQGNIVIPCVSNGKPFVGDGLAVISIMGEVGNVIVDFNGNATRHLPPPADPKHRPNNTMAPQKKIVLRTFSDTYQTREELAKAVIRIEKEVRSKGSGFDSDVNYATVLPIMERAGNMGIVDAQLFLYRYHMSFTAQKPRDGAAASKWLQKALDAGDRRAFREMGYLYKEKDGNRALEYFKKAASMGDIESIVVIADGYSTEQLSREDDWTRFMNLDEAYKWWMKGVELGDACCMYEAGKYLINGNGKIKDEKRGWSYVKKAAEMGWPPAESLMDYYPGNRRN